MKTPELLDFKQERIRILHLTWFAFFLSFFTWFNMAPLATTMVKTSGWLTTDHVKALAILNVALTIPARIVIGSLLDKYGPRIVFSLLLITMAIPTFTFAFGNSWTQLFISRLVLSTVGAGFVIGIRMVAEWFPPKMVGRAEGFYAGWGNFGSAAAAIVLPYVALTMFGGDNGWRYAIVFTGLINLIYGTIYFFVVRDTPEGKVYHKPKKVGAMEVSSFGDMIQLILWTFPLVGALGLLSWRLNKLGFINDTALYSAYFVLTAVFIYQVYKIIQVNVPALKKGVPEDDKYKFRNVGVLNSTYFANFGAELAVISMLPAFFEETFALAPAMAGLIASSFAFVNLFARPLGGLLSDSLNNRRLVMLFYMLGIGIGFVFMGLINSSWPLIMAIFVTVVTSMFVQGAEGATFAIIPLVKKRITGQVAGMAGAYGNVGSVVYLTLFTMVSTQQFFYILAGGAFVSFLLALFFLEEPKGSFAEDYQLSSVDLEGQQQTEQKKLVKNELVNE